MCAPAVAGLIGTAVSIAATTASTVMQAEAQKKQGRFAEEQAKRNAALARRQAADEQQRGAQQAARVRAEGRRTQAQALTQVAAEGQSTTEGSLPNLFSLSGINAGLDSERIKATASRRAWGFEEESQDYLHQGRQARRAGYLGALGTGLSGAGRISSQLGSASQYLPT